MLHETFVVPFEHQQHDHGGEPVSPLSGAGTPYPYAAVDRDRQQITYATTADALLATMITDYQPTELPDDDQAARELYLTQGQRRTEYAYGVCVDNMAQAVISGAVPDEDLQVLRRSLDYDPPLTRTELADWTHHTPMMLIASSYLHLDLVAPAGNVVMLHPTTPETLVESLARAGVIELRRHTLVASPHSTSDILIGEPGPAALLEETLADLDMLLSNLKSPDHFEHHRSSMQILANRIEAWTPQPGNDWAQLVGDVAALRAAGAVVHDLVAAGEVLRVHLVEILEVLLAQEDSDGAPEDQDDSGVTE